MKRYGAGMTPLRKNAVKVNFPEVPPFADSREFVIALERKALGHYPEATLAIPGSPFYLSLMDLARSSGTLTHVYAPIVEPLPNTPPERLFVDADTIDWEPGDGANHPHILFNFAISYHSVVTSDDLVSIGYDVVRKAFRDTELVGALHSVWSETLAENPVDWRELDSTDLEALFPAAMEELNRLIRKKVAKAVKTTQKYLDREISGVEEYYRQLIAEEKQILNRLSRTSPDEAKDQERKIRRYQLDWKRRTAEEVRHHQCRVNIRLVSVAEIFMPRTELVLTSVALPEPQHAYFNHFLGCVDGVVCGDCQGETGPWRVSNAGEWVCEACHMKQNGHPESGHSPDFEPDEEGGTDNEEDKP